MSATYSIRAILRTADGTDYRNTEIGTASNKRAAEKLAGELAVERGIAVYIHRMAHVGTAWAGASEVEWHRR